MGARKTKPEGRPKGIIETKPRQTLKRKRLLLELKKKNVSSLREASIKAGYSRNSRKIYSQGTKRYIKKFLELSGFDLETLQKKYELLYQIAVNEKDYTNTRGCLDSLVKMQGGFREVRDVNLNDQRNKSETSNRIDRLRSFGEVSLT